LSLARADLRRWVTREWHRTCRSEPSCWRASRYLPNRRGYSRMPVLPFIVLIVSHVSDRGEKYGRLSVIREVQKTGADGRRYRAALCRCDCGKEVTTRISSLKSGDAQSCGCSRGQPRYEQKRCPVCGTLAMIRRDHRSCSRGCGYELARVARQAANPSYHVWHKRVKKARGPASGYACVDCGEPAQDWSTVDPSSDDVRVRFQPRKLISVFPRPCHSEGRNFTRPKGGGTECGHPWAATAQRIFRGAAARPGRYGRGPGALPAERLACGCARAGRARARIRGPAQSRCSRPRWSGGPSGWSG